MDDDAAPGVPEWVVTYGDMMSLLLTFFIMLVSLSEIAEDKKYRAIIESLQQYVGYRTSVKAPPGKQFPLNSFLERLKTVGSRHKKREGHGGVRTEAPPGKDLKIFHIAQGTSMRIGEPIVFSSTGTDLSPDAIRQLAAVSEHIAGHPNKLEIVGHVSPDPLPADAPIRDKSLLSYLRARSVLEYLKAHRVRGIRMRIRAASEYEPLPASGDRRSRQHDRVEILIYDKFAEHYMGSRENATD